MANRRRSRDLGGGLAATLAALTAGYWAPGLDLPRIDFAMLNGNLLVPEGTSAAFAWTVGLAHTLVVGEFLARIYRRWVRDRLPGGAATRGALWGLAIAVFAGLTVFPLLYGGGPFGTRWDGGTPVTLVLWFLTWGTALGLAETD